MNSPYLTILKTITPTRIGVGQAADIIDLPVIRDTSTNWPIIPGTSIKGVLRSEPMETYWRSQTPGTDEEPEDFRKRVRKGAEEEVKDVFGSPEGVGSLKVSDLQPVLFPVRSWFGVYALVTCPLALAKVETMWELAGGVIDPAKKPSSLLTAAAWGGDCLVTGNSCLTGQISGNAKSVVLDEFELKPGPDSRLADFTALTLNLLGLSDQQAKSRLLIVKDDLFTFLTEHCTETRSRTALEIDTKSARDGSLRTEEYLPPLAVFAGFGRMPESYAEKRRLQVGSEESVGAGIVQWSCSSKESYAARGREMAGANAPQGGAQ
jgi:CRISPR-associated protein Cmr4